MIESDIKLALQDILKAKEELKQLKKDLKSDEKNDNEDYANLKKAYHNLKTQIQDIEAQFQKDLLDDNNYQTLREMKIKQGEKIAVLNERLQKLIGELPMKLLTIEIDTDLGPVRVQINPEMKVYLNGKKA